MHADEHNRLMKIMWLQRDLFPLFQPCVLFALDLKCFEKSLLFFALHLPSTPLYLTGAALRYITSFFIPVYTLWQIGYYYLLYQIRFALFSFFLITLYCQIWFDIVTNFLLYTGIRHNLYKFFMLKRRTL